MSEESENPLKEFINHVCVFIATKKPSVAISCDPWSTVCQYKLVRTNTDKLDKCGDVYIINDASIWFKPTDSALKNRAVLGAIVPVGDCCGADATDVPRNALGCIEPIYNVADLTTASKHWSLPVSRIVIPDEIQRRCLFYLDRVEVYRKHIPWTLQYASVKTRTAKKIWVKSDGISSTPTVTEYRLKLVEKILKNLINDYNSLILSEDDRDLSLFVTTKSSLKVGENVQKLVSGNVVDPTVKNKLANVTADEYVK